MCLPPLWRYRLGGVGVAIIGVCLFFVTVYMCRATKRKTIVPSASGEGVIGKDMSGDTYTSVAIVGPTGDPHLPPKQSYFWRTIKSRSIAPLRANPPHSDNGTKRTLGGIGNGQTSSSSAGSGWYSRWSANNRSSTLTVQEGKDTENEEEVDVEM